MAPPSTVPLHSDQVNYLIWRYLQEQGYGHAAVHLSRAWNSDPQKLSFAHGVKPHELVSVIQDGIKFDELASTVEARDPKYQFNALRHRNAADGQSTDQSAQQSGDTATNRWRPRVHPLKQKSNDAAKTASDSRQPKPGSLSRAEDMDVDENPAAPNDSELIREEPPAPLVPTLVTGQSKGIQSPAIASTMASLTLPDTDIMDVCWSQSEALVVSGGSCWCAWAWADLVRAAGSESEPDIPSRPLEPSDKPFYVSTAEKDPASGCIASAFADDDISAVFVDSDSTQGSRKLLSANFGGVSLLRWNPYNHNLLVVCHRPQGEEISTWDVDTGMTISFVEYPNIIEDITWKSDSTVIMVGNGFLDSFDTSLGLQDRNNIHKKIDTDILWAFAKYDPITQTCACVAPNQGIIALVASNQGEHYIRTQAFHTGQVTAIEWGESQRYKSLLEATRQEGTMETDDRQNKPIRLLISASAEGTIKGWNATDNLVSLFTIDMGSSVPVMTLAMQNEYLAAAGNGKVCAWKLSWERSEPEGDVEPHPKYMVVWHTPKETAENPESNKIGWPVEESPFHKLAWKPHDNFWSPSERWLAYTTGNQVHLIEIPA